MAGGAFIVAVGAASCALGAAGTLDLNDTILRVRDVISLECVAADQRDTVGDLPIASLQSARTLTRVGLAALIRRRVPALDSVDLSGDGEDLVRLRMPTTQHIRTDACFVAAAPIAAGNVIARRDLMPASCPSAPLGAPVRYDRLHGVSLASADISAGETVGRLMTPPTIVESGEELTLLVRAGPFVIERTVEAVQPSSGEAIFVRDEEGQVFSAPLAQTP